MKRRGFRGRRRGSGSTSLPCRSRKRKQTQQRSGEKRSPLIVKGRSAWNYWCLRFPPFTTCWLRIKKQIWEEKNFVGFWEGINRNGTKAKGNLGIRVRVWLGAEAALSSLQESNPECVYLWRDVILGRRACWGCLLLYLHSGFLLSFGIVSRLGVHFYYHRLSKFTASFLLVTVILASAYSLPCQFWQRLNQ